MYRPRRMLLVAIGLFVAVVVACGETIVADSTSTPTATPTATASPTPTATPRVTRTATPTPTATPDTVESPREQNAPTPEPEEPTVRSISELVSEFGEPGHANFARLRIPVLGVDAPVGAYFVDGQMVAPANPVEVAWYDMSNFPGMGGAPGQGGNAIFSAHVDYFARVPYADGSLYRGRGVFFDLALLSPGDVIEVEYQGQVLTYRVAWRKQVNADTGDWGEIWSGNGVDSITLYTCGGDFDWNTRNYEDRIVVRAERA
jgi:sortase (surface protein transpeptidase)